MSLWKFTPYNLEKWNDAEERVLFVGPEPNEDKPLDGIFDMGKLFRMAYAENKYLGNKRFYTRCEIMLKGLGVGFDAFRFMDLKAEGGGAQANPSTVSEYVENNLGQVCKYFTSTDLDFGLAPHIIILLGKAQRVFVQHVWDPVKKVADSELKWVGMPSPSSMTGYIGLEHASANIRQHLKPITEQAERWTYDPNNFNDWKSMDEELIVDRGVFYLIQLEPCHDPGRFKVGFASNLSERLRDHRCSAPLATVLAKWPCRPLWEKTAIDCVTQSCEQIHTEVFRTDDISAVQQRCEQFFSLMSDIE